jgi:hypothetical protein
MEDFNQNSQRFDNIAGQAPVREKNMYLLHLDTTRIIILSAILVAVVAVSFLLGMNFTGDDTAKTASSDNNELMLDSAADLPGSTPAMLSETPETDPLKEQLSSNTAPLRTEDILNPVRTETARTESRTSTAATPAKNSNTATAAARPAAGTTRQSSATARTSNTATRTQQNAATRSYSAQRQPETRAASGRVNPAPATTASSAVRSG